MTRLRLLGLTAIGLILAACAQAPPVDIIKIGNGLTQEYTGRVVDTSGKPLASATIKAGSLSTEADADGYWSLTFSSDQQHPDTITYFRRGYAPYTGVLSVTGGIHHQTILQDALAMQTLDVSLGGTISADYTDDGIDDIKLVFPAGFLSGMSTVDVTLSYINALETDALQRFPGNFASQDNGDLTSRALTRSFGAVNVTFHLGNTLINDVTLAAPARLELSLGSENSFDLSAGDHVDLSWLNTDNGDWIRDTEGIVVVQNGIVAVHSDISHFTWWNAERTLDQHSCVTLVLEPEAALSSAFAVQFELIAAGSDYLSAAQPVVFDSLGRASTTAWKNHDARLSYRYRGAGNQGLHFAAGDHTELKLTNNGSTLDTDVGAEHCKEVVAPFPYSPGIVEGFVLDAAKQPVDGTVVSIPELGLHTRPNPENGFYSFSDVPWSPTGLPLTVRASPTDNLRITAQEITLSTSRTRVDLTAGTHPKPPWFVSHSLSNSQPATGETVHFSVTVRDDLTGLSLSTIPTVGTIESRDTQEKDDGSTYQVTVTGSWKSSVTAVASELHLIVKDASDQESTLILKASWN